MPANAIDNSNLQNYRKNLVIDPAFVPAATYAYDSSAKTVAVKDASAFPATDGLQKAKVRVMDSFGKELRGTITLTGNHPATVDVSTLDASKGLNLEVTVLTNNGLHAEGSAFNLQPAGNASNWNITDQGTTGS